MKYEIRKIFDNGKLSNGCVMIEAESPDEAKQKYLEQKNFKRKVARLQITEAVAEEPIESEPGQVLDPEATDADEFNWPQAVNDI